MKKIYVAMIILLSFLLVGNWSQAKVFAEETEDSIVITIKIGDEYPTEFTVGDQKPATPFIEYFDVKQDGEDLELTEDNHEFDDSKVVIDAQGRFSEVGNFDITLKIHDSKTGKTFQKTLTINVNPNPAITVTTDPTLPNTFIQNGAMPDWNKYFVVKDGKKTEGDGIVLIPGPGEEAVKNLSVVSDFDITKVGTYQVTVSYKRDVVHDENDEDSLTLDFYVVASDIEAPEVTRWYHFHEEETVNIDGELRVVVPWDARDKKQDLINAFVVYDRIDGAIVPNESMFEGLEKVRFNNYGGVYPIKIKFTDQAGNENIFAEFDLYIVNSLGRVVLEVDNDLPVEFIINTEEPNLKKYFKVVDNGVNVDDFVIRRGGFDITKAGTYMVSVIYQRQFVFRNDLDIGKAEIEMKVILKDETAPDIITYKIDDDYNEHGQLPWTYNKSLDILISRFRVKDNVDGVIPVTREMFKGIEEVDITKINTEYIVVFEVTDKNQNTATKTIKLYILDDIQPFLTNFSNRYYSTGKKLDILEVAKEIGINDNYDSNDSVLTIVFSNPNLFKKETLSYHDDKKNIDRFTEEEIARAAQAYNYVFVDGTHTVHVRAFRTDDDEKILIDKQYELIIENGVVTNLDTIHEDLGLDRNNGLIIYLFTNFETGKNGEFAVIAQGLDTSNNIAPIRPFRIVIENGPSLLMILLIINVAALGVIGISIGSFLGIRKVRLRKGEEK